ncbi:MAG: oligosaccharide flippase family protein, partial [Gammaproteobacteria bacterium]|nr:oligosaccharide flippase family protein [Gammaproteobacteria bacterium]
MHRNMASGAFWVAFAASLGKVATFATQIVLGWLLSKEDFGTYAIVLSIGASVAVLRNGGTQQLLIQRGVNFDEHAPAIFKFGLAFNILAFVLLIALAMRAARFYEIPELVPLASLLALSIILASPGLILRAQVALSGRFRSLALVTATSDVTRQVLTILFAVLGFGVYSFMFPLALEPLILMTLLYLVSRSWPRSRHVPLQEYVGIFRESRWIMLSNLAIAARLNGPYFVISLFEAKALLGVYFFAAQLVVSLTTMFSTAINEVVFPSLSKVVDHTSSHHGIFLKAARASITIGACVSLALIAVGSPIIELVWNGKWDESIGCVAVLATTFAPVILIVLCLATLASRGLWKPRLAVLITAAAL